MQQRANAFFCDGPILAFAPLCFLIVNRYAQCRLGATTSVEQTLREDKNVLALKLEFVILALLLFFLWNTQSLEKSRSSWSGLLFFRSRGERVAVAFMQ